MDARDEIALARKKMKSKYRRKRLGVLLRIVLAAAVVFVIASLVTAATVKDAGDLVKVLFSGGSYPVALSGTSPRQVEQLNMGFAVRTADSVLIVSSSGALLQTIKPDYNNIGMACSKNKVLVYHSGGEKLSLYNRTQQIFSLETEQPIISCAVGAGSLTAVVCQDERYAASLTLYNTNQQTLFTWYCASAFPYAVVFDSNASHVAVLSAYIENGMTRTQVTVIDISSQQETLKCELPFLALKLLLHNSEFTALGDTGAVKVASDGSVTHSYTYPGKLICCWAQTGSDIALAFGDNSMPLINTVTVLDENLYERCSINTGEEIRDMQLSSGRVYVLSANAVTAYTLHGVVAKTANSPYNAIALVAARKVVVIMPDTADVVN